MSLSLQLPLPLFLPLLLLFQINWIKCLIGKAHNRCLITVDGTDFRIQEPFPFSREWFSQKFTGAGVRYGVVMCIQTGEIVWFNGPFPCGLMTDIRIFRLKLKGLLLPGEKVMADKGYKGDPKTCTPFEAKNNNHKKVMCRARARHETVNGRFKTWGCLKQVWRHGRSKHVLAFNAVATITQLEIENGRPPFQVDGYEDSAFVH